MDFIWDFILILFPFSILKVGGPLVFILFCISVLSLGVIIEKLFFLQQKKIIPLDHIQEIETELRNQNLEDALFLCSNSSSPLMNIIKIGILNWDKTIVEIRIVLEDAGKLEMPFLEKRLTILSTISVISPLLGLLGTVLGMIRVFEKIKLSGAADITQLSGGISEALLTTALGMFVAIPCIVAYNYFSRKIDILSNEMERHTLTLIEIFRQIKLDIK